MMIRWWKHGEKGVTDGQTDGKTDGRTDWTSHIAAWSQLNIYKTCSCCGRDSWHIESKQILQPPKNLLIIVNRITYSNNRTTKNKSRMPLGLYIKLGPYKFSLQASVDHHGYSMNSGHHTASINCCGKTFHCNDNEITECNVTVTYNSSTAYILLYKLVLGRQCASKGVCRCWHCWGSTAWPWWELIDSHGAGTVVCPFTTGRGIDTETCEMDNVFPPDYL